MSDLAHRIASRIAEWRRDPVLFVRENFAVEPDPWQVQALEAWASPDPKARRIALQACAGPGKSAVLAWCAWHFLMCQGRSGHHPAGYALSVTGDNLRDNLWKELAIWRGRSVFLQEFFEWTAECVFAKDHKATWWLRARTWSKTADPEAQGRTLSGLHSEYIAYFIDESGDIGPQVLRASEQGLGNCTWGKIAIAGNPTSHEGILYDAVANQSHKWTVVRISGDPDDSDRSQRIDVEWAREQIQTYGRENPWVMAYVLGKFPPSSLNTLLGPDEIRASMARHVPEDQYAYAQKRLGVDVARFGDDQTVIFPRQGLMAFEPVPMRNARSHEIAARIAQAKATWGSEMEFIDDTGGWGAGVIDSCLLGGIGLVPVNFSTGAFDPRYFNKRSEMHFAAAEWVKRGGALPDVPTLVREGSAPTYWFENGKLRVEEKAQIKKRLGSSPDYWDALLTTFAVAEMPANVGALTGSGHHTGGKLLSDYDPFEEGRW